MWQRESITQEDFDFETVRKYYEYSHDWRYLEKCRKCGQLYVFDNTEQVDWLKGNDKIYSTLIPVSEEEAKQFDPNNKSPLELLASEPVLLWNPDDSVKWIRENPLH
ncbi:MAG: hypothetical protein Q7S76_00115 [bacterium]|nr:hypothetical protein [bacterium]